MGTAGVAGRIELQNFMGAELKVNSSFCFAVVLLVLQLTLTALKQRKLCWYVKFSQWIGQFWIQEVIRAHLETCLRLSSIDEVG